MKRFLCLLLSLVLILGMVPPTPANAATVPVYYNSYSDLKYTHSDVYDWDSTCFICSVAMILSTKGIPNSTPYDVWVNNGRQSYVWWANIHNAYGVTSSNGGLGGSAEEIRNTIISLCQSHPEGVLLSGTTVKGTTHAVVAFIDDYNNVFYHDPGSTNWNSLTVNPNAYFFTDYTQFDSYRVFNGGQSVTVTMNWVDHYQEAKYTDFYTKIKAQANISGYYGDAGITVWDANKNIVAQKYENPNYTNSSLDIWYNITEETGAVLQEGKDYTYQYHTKFNNQYYYSPVYSIKTLSHHTHDYGEWVTTKEAKCGIAGEKTKTCGCGDKVTEPIPALEHDYQEESVFPADCLNPAHHIVTCQLCGDDKSYTDEVVFSGWSTEYPEGVAETWIDTRTQYRYCDKVSAWSDPVQGSVDCIVSWPAGFDTNHGLYAQYNKTPPAAGESDTEKIEVLYSAEIGYLYWHWCRGSYTSGPIDRQIRDGYSSQYPAFHAYFSTGTTTNMDGSGRAYNMGNASCCRDSLWYFRTPVYQVVYTTQVRNPNADSWGSWSDWSETVYTESDTRKVEQRKIYSYVVSGLGEHDYGEGEVTLEPTINSTGIRTFTCSVCYDVYTEVIPAIEHSHVFIDYESDNNATCTQDGTITAKCEGCNETNTIVDRGSKKPHPYGDWTVVKASTCKEMGTERRDCETCDAFEERPITQLADHKYEGTVTKPTCTAGGYTTYSCTVCGDSYVSDYTDPAHSFGSWITGKEPTCTQEGIRIRICSCNETDTEVLKALGHDYVNGSCSRCGDPQDEESGSVTRIAGASRYLTAITAADTLKGILGIQKFQSVIIASGTNFADALAGSYLAAVKSAPILLSTKKSDADNLNYIRNNLSSDGTVYILGGTTAVSDSIETMLKTAGINVKRLAGKDRYKTNLLILEEAGFSGGEVLVAIGNNFADSLSASATGKPILLVGPKWDQISSDYVNYLSGKTCSFTIIGGTGAVKEAIETDLRSYGSVRRIFGSNRLQTSVTVAQTYFASPDAAVLACSTDFPDGLCGGPLAYALGAPLLLVNSGKEAAAAAYVAANGIRNGYVMGGEAVVSKASVQAVFP